MWERPSLRERNRQRTAAEIEAAAFDLFQARGYEATTVELIAVAAGVSTRTFFRYFPTKEDVVFGNHAASVARLRAALAEGDAGEPPLRRVRRAVLAVQNPGGNRGVEIARARLVAEVPAVRARFSSLVEDFEEAVSDALAAGFGSGEEGRARATIVAAAVFGALRGARRAAGLLSDPDPERLVEAAFDLVEHGAGRLLAAPETRA